MSQSVHLSQSVSHLVVTLGLAFVFGLALRFAVCLLEEKSCPLLSVFLARSDGEVYEKGEETLCVAY